MAATALNLEFSMFNWLCSKFLSLSLCPKPNALGRTK